MFGGISNGMDDAPLRRGMQQIRISGKTLLAVAMLALLGASIAGAGVSHARERLTRAAGAVQPNVQTDVQVIAVFGRPGCPYCARAKVFLDALEARRPDVQVIHYNVLADPAALARLRQIAAEAGHERLAVPAILVGGEPGNLIIGFDQSETTGQQIEALLAPGTAPEATTRVPAEVRAGMTDGPPAPPGEVVVPLFGRVSASELGLPLFTVVIGLVDGFNPCAMWVLLFLLSLLVNLHSRARMALIGGTFVVVSGAVYYAFMAAWLSFFLLVGLSRGVQVVLGLVALAVGAIHIKDFFAFQKGISLSIPDAAKRGIYGRVRRIIHAENLGGALVMVVVLAAMVNMVELLCTAGLPAIYTQVLASHDLPAWKNYLYLFLYIVIYMLDDALMLAIAVVTLGRRKLQERGGRWLKLLSGIVMAILGILLIARPEWLSWG